MQVGNLCYVNQEGSKYYDMENAHAIKEQLEVSTILGTVKSTVNIDTKIVVQNKI